MWTALCTCVWSHFHRVWLCVPMDCSPPDFCVHGILQARIMEICRHDLLQGIFPTQGWDPFLWHVPALEGDSLLLVKSENESCSFQPHGLYSPWYSPGQNIGVGSSSLLQGIFLTQGLNPGMNPGLLHCRQILYISASTISDILFYFSNELEGSLKETFPVLPGVVRWCCFFAVFCFVSFRCLLLIL